MWHDRNASDNVNDGVMRSEEKQGTLRRWRSWGTCEWGGEQEASKNLESLAPGRIPCVHLSNLRQCRFQKVPPLLESGKMRCTKCYMSEHTNVPKSTAIRKPNCRTIGAQTCMAFNVRITRTGYSTRTQLIWQKLTLNERVLYKPAFIHKAIAWLF